ncbi:hypothetical protein CGGC5_v003750 [Colletotrichum fructicola Nara gc5]|uniref:Uncharacterized protein n=1 Tax=Colletotrichum fructicola (strain Nara gc5) TaxID=1213859 RepID=A0A7J6JIS2_COLFN|nr:hypothetical protein CFRS1_v002252 [Colletotrichum fructicola]KAF4478263.1 hypothetical protein CGGC5_v013839 [Colletotrichum fructicola Nara gc5]KAF4490131.1 hypothetical protein CGGC5_v003750 [Colletotrichum fructicola Nara gc5]
MYQSSYIVQNQSKLLIILFFRGLPNYLTCSINNPLLYPDRLSFSCVNISFASTTSYKCVGYFVRGLPWRSEISESMIPYFAIVFLDSTSKTHFQSWLASYEVFCSSRSDTRRVAYVNETIGHISHVFKPRRKSSID